MRRREFIGLVGGGAAAWPLAVRAQQAMPVVGFLNLRSAADSVGLATAFQQGLNEAGFVEGRNVAITYRWANGRNDQLAGLAADLARQQVAVIAATGGSPSVLAAKAATNSIPIVFTMGGDPVQFGLVASLNKPGGNVTGVASMFVEMGAKRLELLRQIVPSATKIAMLINPSFPLPSPETREVNEAARSLGVEIIALKASVESEIDDAFVNVAQQKIDALIVGADPFQNARRDRLVRLAAQYAVPAMYWSREFIDQGGLISYGANQPSAYRQAGMSAARILKGEKPSDLPVIRPTKFELVINLKTAKALGIEIPPTLLARADEVIE